MPIWLLLEANLRFNPSLRSTYPQKYRADLLPDGGDLYYGVHFVSPPLEIQPGDELLVELMVRAFPEDPCAAFQPGRKVFLKEGSIVRAEGRITRRWERESAARTVSEFLQERSQSLP